MSLSTELFLEYKKQPGRPALARLLERHQDAVYALCLQVLRHPQDAEDACQEVLLEVSRQVDAIEEPSKFAGWLYRTALHTALDVRRKRGRTRVREERARRPSEAPGPRSTPDEALHEGLAELDDRSRMLVVEHYFSRRPLRELAMELGCSEVAVWKRLQSARERLKKSLGSAVLGALDVMAKVPRPAGLVQKALGLEGGLAMAAKGGITLAIAAPILLLGVAGTLLSVRRGEPPALSTAARRSTAVAGTSEMPAASPSSSSAVAPPAQPPKTREARPRRPYPFNPAARGASNDVAAHTWSLLSSKRVALAEGNTSLAELLERIGIMTGLTFRLDPTLKAEARLSFQVNECVADDCLQMALDFGDNDFEILPDGTVHVGPKSTITGGFEREARKMEATLLELKTARTQMDAGWDGLRDPHDPSGLKAKKTLLPQGESTLHQELDRLCEDELFVRVDIPVLDVKDHAAYQAVMNRPFLQTVEEKTVGEHVEQLAKMSGLVAVGVDENLLCLTTQEKAAEYRAKNEERRRAYEQSLATLEKASRESGTLWVQDFLDSISRSGGLPVVPSEEVWDSPATLTLPPGATLRSGLDLLKAQGVRWALRNGKIFVFR